MALIKCKYCGNEISDKAIKCVHCGKDLSIGIEDNNPNKKRLIKIMTTIIVICILIAVGITVPIIVTKKKNQEIERIRIEEANNRIQKVIDDIDSIGEITLSSKDILDVINKEYLELPEEDRSKVSNYNKLKSAYDKVSMLELESTGSQESNKVANNEVNKTDNKNVLDKIKRKVDSADTIIDTYLQEMNNSSDYISFINNKSRVLEQAKEYLDEAYELCGNEKEFDTLKIKINNAKKNIPVNPKINLDSDASNFLDKLRDLAYDLYALELEIIDLYEE